MFVAGIKIFFGFVAGSIILGLGIAFIYFACLIIRKLFAATGLILKPIGSWIKKRSDWITGIVFYCWLAFRLTDSSNIFALEAGAVMLVALLVAALVKLYFVSNQKTSY